jgi:acetyl-CoA carboxylase carboxyl transferase subunit beta
MRISATGQIFNIVDEGQMSFFDFPINTYDRLEFPGYSEKISQIQNGAYNREALLSGVGQVGGINVVIMALDPEFMVGTVNTAVGEMIKSTIVEALDRRLPLVTITASAGARMQEGIFSLIEFSSILYLWDQLSMAKIPTINILGDPTFGGVSASFGFLADYVYAIKGAQIGFAGKRVISQIEDNDDTDFQTAEGLFNHGQVDGLLSVDNIRQKVIDIVKLHV